MSKHPLRYMAVILIFALAACSHQQVVERREFRINYSLKERAVVSITIHASAQDELRATSYGPSVRQLCHNEVQSEGVRRASWDGLDDKGRPAEAGEYQARINAKYLKLKKLDPLGGSGTIFNPQAVAVIDEGGAINPPSTGGYGEAGERRMTIDEHDYSYYVVDTGNRRVVKLDKHGHITQQLGSFGSGVAQLANPVDLALDTDFVVSVCDAGNDRIQRYDHRGNHLSAIQHITKHQGSMEIPEELKDPQGIAFDSYGNFLISDSGHDRVVCLNDSSWLLWETDGFGSGSGQLSNPRGIAVDSEGNIYVADKDNSRISVFESDGRFSKNIDSFSLANGEKVKIESPEKLAILCDGLLAISDSGLDNVIICDLDGTVLTIIRDLGDPSGLYCKDSLLHITESTRHIISSYLFEFEADEQTWEIEGEIKN